MASLRTVDDVLRGVLGEDGDSDSDFDGYTSGGDDSEANGGCDKDPGDSSNGGNAGGDGNGSSGIPQYLYHVTDGMLEEVVKQTNLYAQQYLDAHDLLPKSRKQQWKSAQHDIVELKKYLALVIGMGIVSHPRVEDAWVTTWPFTSSAFSGIMSRNRFSLVMSFLHLNDSRG